MIERNVADIRTGRQLPPHGGNGDGGGVTGFRLGELERRMGVIEGKVDDLTNTCTRIETKLNELASKSYVLWIFGGTAAVIILSILGHMLLRAFTFSG